VYKRAAVGIFAAFLIMVITKGILNIVVLTLNEKKTAACDWLLEFINESTGESKVLSVTDTSVYPERYNLFTITEGTDITLSTSGTWKYKAHQMPVSSPKDTNTSNSIKVCEESKCHVIDAQENTIVSFSTDDEKDTPAFDN
jgi:hypothetical protein